MREAVRSELLEIPAGILDVDGEDGARCAARELLEETGFQAAHVEGLASFYTSPGFSDERIQLFLARRVQRGAGPGEPGVAVVTVPFAEAMDAVRAGAIVDAKSIVGLLMAEVRTEESR
jgi:ADP-ribose pyrophosphatase